MKYFLVVDDHEIVRSGVKNISSEKYKPCEVYEATDGKSALTIPRPVHQRGAWFLNYNLSVLYIPVNASGRNDR